MVMANEPASAVSRNSRSAVTESPTTRITLIAIALAFLALFLILPVIAVFVEAFRKGLVTIWRHWSNRTPGLRSVLR